MEKSEIYCLDTLGGQHLGQKEVCMLYVSSINQCQKFGGAYKKHFS